MGCVLDVFRCMSVLDPRKSKGSVLLETLIRTIASNNLSHRKQGHGSLCQMT